VRDRHEHSRLVTRASGLHRWAPVADIATPTLAGCSSARFGNDNRDRLADMVDLANRQNRVRRDKERQAVAAFQRHLIRVCRHRAVRDRLQAVPFSVAAGQHRDDPGIPFAGPISMLAIRACACGDRII
jgi:hypothetical protein